MKELITKYDFYHFSTGCACQGLPRYYKNDHYPDYRIVTKGGAGIIKKSGVELFRTKDVLQLKTKMDELFIKSYSI
jgi:hypothetical protein